MPAKAKPRKAAVPKMNREKIAARIVVSVPESLLRRLYDMSEESGAGISEITRRALDAYLPR